MKRTILFLLILVMSIITAVIFSGCAKKQEPLVLSSTQSGKCGDFRWSITSILRTEETGTDQIKIRGKGELLIVGLNIKNELRKKVELDPSVLTLSDGGKREYKPDEKLTADYLKMLGSNKFKTIYSTEILPLDRAQVFAIFDIKKEVKGLRLTVSANKVGGDRDLVFKIDI